MGWGLSRLSFHKRRSSCPADAMIRHGLGDAIDIIQSPWSQEGGEEAGRPILSRFERRTAVFAGCDVAAVGVRTTLWSESIRVPNELSVAGFDKIFTSSLAPISITTVDQWAPQRADSCWNVSAAAPRP